MSNRGKVCVVGTGHIGLPLAAYTILTATSSGWTVEQRRVPYDAAAEIEAAQQAGKPEWTSKPV